MGGEKRRGGACKYFSRWGDVPSVPVWLHSKLFAMQKHIVATFFFSLMSVDSNLVHQMEPFHKMWWFSFHSSIRGGAHKAKSLWTQEDEKGVCAFVHACMCVCYCLQVYMYVILCLCTSQWRPVSRTGGTSPRESQTRNDVITSTSTNTMNWKHLAIPILYQWQWWKKITHWRGLSCKFMSIIKVKSHLKCTVGQKLHKAGNTRLSFPVTMKCDNHPVHNYTVITLVPT